MGLVALGVRVAAVRLEVSVNPLTHKSVKISDLGRGTKVRSCPRPVRTTMMGSFPHHSSRDVCIWFTRVLEVGGGDVAYVWHVNASMSRRA